jgi:hypothetical protein
MIPNCVLCVFHVSVVRRRNWRREGPRTFESLGGRRSVRTHQPGAPNYTCTYFDSILRDGTDERDGKTGSVSNSAILIPTFHRFHRNPANIRVYKRGPLCWNVDHCMVDDASSDTSRRRQRDCEDPARQSRNRQRHDDYLHRRIWD